mmetsp:Transcript_10927/g.18028  ORF Transcript_10927/g.18028 Transcript_10927/m.18028 type:complete len:227 (-) Transcript_10927:289-969(-)
MYATSTGICLAACRCCTFTATRRPSRRVALWTWPMDALAMGCSSKCWKSSSTDLPKSSWMVFRVVWKGAAGIASRSFRSSARTSSGHLSPWVLMYCPTFGQTPPSCLKPRAPRNASTLYLALKKRLASSSQSRFASHALCMYFHRTRTHSHKARSWRNMNNLITTASAARARRLRCQPHAANSSTTAAAERHRKVHATASSSSASRCAAAASTSSSRCSSSRMAEE